MAAKPPLTVDDLVDLQVPQHVAVAPTGKRVAYVVKTPGQARDHDVSAIWMAKVDTPNSARQVTSGMHHDWSPVWAPDDTKRLAFLSDRFGKGSSCSIYLMHREHLSEPMCLTPNHTRNIITHMTWSPDGQYIAFLSPTTPQCKEGDVENDTCEYGVDWKLNQLYLLHVSSRSVTTMYSGSSHVSDVAWRADSKQVFCALHCNSSFDSAIENGVDILSIDVSTRHQEDLGTFDGPLRSRLQYSDNALFFIAGKVPGLFNTSGILYMLDMSTQKLAALGGATDSCMANVVCLPHARILHVQQNMFDELWARKRDANFKLLWGAPQEITSYDAAQTGTDGATVIALISSTAGSPPEVFTLSLADLFAKTDHKPVQVSSHGAHLRTTRRLGKATEINCKSFDKQVTLRGMFVAPEDYIKRSKGPLPTVVMIHGGPHLRVTDAFLPRAMGHCWAIWLVSNGYGVLCPNYRGSAGQGDSFARAAHGRMGTVDYDDTLALVEEGMRLGAIDRDHVAVSGWSQGGFLAYLSAARNGYAEESGKLNWQYRGAICGAGVTEWVSRARLSGSSKTDSRDRIWST